MPIFQSEKGPLAIPRLPCCPGTGSPLPKGLLSRILPQFWKAISAAYRVAPIRCWGRAKTPLYFNSLFFSWKFLLLTKALLKLSFLESIFPLWLSRAGDCHSHASHWAWQWGKKPPCCLFPEHRSPTALDNPLSPQGAHLCLLQHPLATLAALSTPTFTCRIAAAVPNYLRQFTEEGSQFQGFQSLVAWLRCFWVWVGSIVGSMW